MKAFGRLCTASLLALSVAGSVLAGDIHIGGNPPSGDPPLTTTTPGVAPLSNSQEAALCMTDVALNVLQDLLTVF